MSDSEAPLPPPPAPSDTRLIRRRQARRWLIVPAIFAAIIALFYGVEDWRGKQAWESYKREMAAKGQTLELSAYIGAPVRDELNAFKAPKMTEWFARGSLRILNPSTPPTTLADITVLPPSSNLTAKASQADLVLLYVSPGKALFEWEDSEWGDSTNKSMVILDEVDLPEAIRNLARVAGLNIQFDPQAGPLLRQSVTLSFHPITALQALLALLNKYGLQLNAVKTDPNISLWRVTAKAPGSPSCVVGFPAPAENPPAATDTPAAGLNDGEATPTLITFDDVNLGDAITALARQAELKLVVAPDAEAPLKAISVSVKWRDVTPRQALQALLDNYGLQLRYDFKTAATHLALKKPAPTKPVPAKPSELRQKIQTALHNATGPMIEGALAIPFLARPLADIKPVRIVLVAEAMPNPKELTELFGEFFPQLTPYARSTSVQVSSAASNTFTLDFKAANSGDYLAANDPLEPDFDLMRQALKRPYAQMDDEFLVPSGINPTDRYFNFAPLRIVSQALAQRAQCCLLLGQPDKALRQVTLIRQLSRLEEGRPARLPMSVVGPIISIALNGLYVSVVADGLRMGAWQEPQLAALEEQLQQIDLLPLAAKALMLGRTAGCHQLENTPMAQLEETYGWPPKTNYLGRVERFFLFTLGPRGWVYQNMVWGAKLVQPTINSVDVANHLIVPHQADQIGQTFDRADHFAQGETLLTQGKLNAACREFGQELRNHFSPYSYLGVRHFTDFRGMVANAARNQTLANQALIVCALERYRLAHRQYPESLEALSPQFIKTIPRDLIGGRPLRYRRWDDGTFILYSVGWNEKDDGGAGESWYDNQGDWVWGVKQW